MSTEGKAAISSMRSPCRDCPERTVGCHGKCEAYKAYRGVLDEINRKRLLYRESFVPPEEFQRRVRNEKALESNRKRKR